ncbi:MAG: metalloregulator ArsR/SmtB family transcription factor [Akkermansia sp.]
MSDCTTHQAETICSSPQELEKQANFFKALGHPVRLAIVEMLLGGERCVCELHENSQRDMSTISSHLKSLKAAGVISSEQRGKNIYYSLCCPCVALVLGAIRKNVCKTL